MTSQYPRGRYGQGLRGVEIDPNPTLDKYGQVASGYLGSKRWPVRGMGSLDENGVYTPPYVLDDLPTYHAKGAMSDYLSWSAPGQEGVASNSPSPISTTNPTGSGAGVVSLTQWVGQNTGLITLAGLGLIALLVIKR